MRQAHHVPKPEELPGSLVQTLSTFPGGPAWLRQLPELLEACAERWSLTLHPPFPALSYNFVAPATRADGTPAVLKMGLPNPELRTETEALRLFGGRGSVRLLASDEPQGALLLERLSPGQTLFIVEDDAEATEIAIEVMARLWLPRPPEDLFPTVARWAEGLKRLRERYDGGTGPLPARLVEAAEHWFDRLIPTMAAPVLLHGDLHQQNILSAERQPWLAVDPKGVIGEPAYEVGAWLRNPPPGLPERSILQKTFERRVDQFVERLGFDRQRVVGWGLAQAVLSAWWSVEDTEKGWEPAIACAALLESLL